MQASDHQRSDAISRAADWLMEPRAEKARATVPELRGRFGLSARDAIEAIKEANLRRARSL